MTYIILYVISHIVGIIGIILNVRSVIKTLRAQRNLSIALQEHMKDPTGELAKAVTNSRKHLKRSKLDPRELQKLFLIVERITYELPRKEQEYIFEGLHQKSAKGRANNLRRLINKSNIIGQTASI